MRFSIVCMTLALAGTLLPGAVGPTPPARADHAPDHNPEARLQLVIRSIHFFADGDWIGSGDMDLRVGFVHCPEGVPPDCTEPNRGGTVLAWWQRKFDAHAGDIKVYDRVIPPTSDAPGIPVYAGERYFVYVTIWDDDFGLSDIDWEFEGSGPWPSLAEGPDGADWLGGMGHLVDWQRDSTHGPWTQRSRNGGSQGGYEVTYEIRRPPLPDLVPRSAGIAAAGGAYSVCGVVANIGQQPASITYMQWRVYDGDTLLFLAGGDAGSLAVGATVERCEGAPVIPAGQHRIELTVDSVRLEPEMDETNNRYAVDIFLRPASVVGPQEDMVGPGVPGAQPDQSTPTPTAVRPPVLSPKPEVVGPGGPVAQADRPTSTPTAAPARPTPAQARPDLRVSAIRVRGGKPGGQHDCDPGKNDVTVEVKNQGTRAAAPSIVRLVVDEQATEKPIASLDAGKETAVRFDDLQLKKGEHRLAATVDVAKAISEANEDNNELKLTVTCDQEG